MSIYFGVDFHARQQFIKWCDISDGEVHEQQLFHHAPEEVREFYTRFQGEVIVGLEASGYSSWFETMLQQIGHQVWVGNPTEIRRRARSRQKTDRRDAELLLELLLKDEFSPPAPAHPSQSGSVAAVALPASFGPDAHQDLQRFASYRPQCGRLAESKAQDQ